MVSLFNMFVTGIVTVPELDHRLVSHVDAPAVVHSDQGPAAPEQGALAAEAPVDQVSSATSAPDEVMAPDSPA